MSPIGRFNSFQAEYGPDITKEEVYEYAYGVMHAPDWRQRYHHDLQRNLPRIPPRRRLRGVSLSRPRPDELAHRL